MKTKISITCLIICVALLIECKPTQKTEEQSLNFQCGVEAAFTDREQAINYFEKDLRDNPKNGYSHFWIGMIQLTYENFESALSATDLALQYLPEKDIEQRSRAYYQRAVIYWNLQDSVNTLADMSSAIHINPKEASLYGARAYFYSCLNRYDLSKADYQKITRLEPHNTDGHMGLGRIAINEKRWEDALKHFNKVIKLDDENSEGYSRRAISYLGLEKWEEATDDLITAFRLNDELALSLIEDLDESVFNLLFSKMKAQCDRKPVDVRWPYLVASMYEKNYQYEKAIEYYNMANNLTKDGLTMAYFRISICQGKLGYYEKAIRSVHQAIQLDKKDVDCLSLKANLYYELGYPDVAIALCDETLVMEPYYAWGYYLRGWIKKMIGNYESAMEDLSVAIILEPTNSQAYLARGDIFQKQGKTDLAENDFRKIIEIEDEPDNYDCIMFAYQRLGQEGKAKAVMDSIMMSDSMNCKFYYEAACLYSRMNDKENALAYLEKAIELGYRRFAHMEREKDLDNIRETAEFQSIILKGKKDLARELAPKKSISLEET